ncbi:hypothetical protein [Segetibacter aerophilus]|uniref:Uncharacterized protein n=1 Tax=Segetibacter aerophilus TaxID=670293 RepID=A0A512B9T3_9BACT|nr:hypothetical protein [Segetibacter aerophilus]GEO08714.1 hypothetical protein SAE01_12100 [Segetibacter aerophilus]
MSKEQQLNEQLKQLNDHQNLKGRFELVHLLAQSFNLVASTSFNFSGHDAGEVAVTSKRLLTCIDQLTSLKNEMVLDEAQHNLHGDILPQAREHVDQ